MKLNFDIIKGIPGFTNIYNASREAEANQWVNPARSATCARMSMENMVKVIYYLKGWEKGKRETLFELLTREEFVSYINCGELISGIHYIRKVGNKALHDALSDVTRKESLFSVVNLYHFVGSVMQQLGLIETFDRFDETLIPHKLPLYVSPSKVDDEEKRIDKGAVLGDTLNPNMDTGLSEAETRSLFIDQYLEEAGWSVVHEKGAYSPGKACIEIKVEGMPNASGTGYVDYVLYGNNGVPLAVVEAKKTLKSAAAGEEQAILYADSLEKQYGLRPVIYYTNGIDIFVIDGQGGPSRRLYGFHTKQDLQTIISRRGNTRIKDMSVDDEIAGRPYQIEAVKAVCERFNNNNRRALLVMATGTGKTRVSIAISDILLRNNRVKNILFLADRTTLVRQAHKNYVKLLPSHTACILSEDKEPDMKARIMFSTYQTMINYIDRDEKGFSVGRFDLIIIDEAHRSVFGKYGSIFDYFDSLLIGLTATPRDEIVRSTYDLLGQEQGQPTSAYEYDEAVADGFLSDYELVNRKTLIMDEGIKYDDLDNEAKSQLEEYYSYEAMRQELEEVSHNDVESNKIFKVLYNKDTIDKVLCTLMDEGLKINNGSTIGKTIIFAMNHKHAELIVERFNALYPDCGEQFCRLVDYSVNYAQSIIDNFAQRESLPMIAVSVDMLDTGVDVPDILNLVFFKKVRSIIKFRQMIGRGTRKSNDIFGTGHDKEKFLIFDWCGNFEYFNLHAESDETARQMSKEERIFGLKLDIASLLQLDEFSEDEFAVAYLNDLKDEMCAIVGGLSISIIAVRKVGDVFVKYSKRENWNHLRPEDVAVLKNKIGPVIPCGGGDHYAMIYDILVHKIELALAGGEKYENEQSTMIAISNNLSNMQGIPQIKKKIDTIREVASDEFWEEVNLSKLEYVRKELRDLIIYLKNDDSATFIINIPDMIMKGEDIKIKNPRMAYGDKLKNFVEQESDSHPVLKKLRSLEQLTNDDILDIEAILWDELGSKEEYEQYVANMKFDGNVPAFIRSIVGIDRDLAIKKFEKFLGNIELNSDQIRLLDDILSYVTINGDISPEVFGDSPFNNYNLIEMFGDKASYFVAFIDKLHDVIEVRYLSQKAAEDDRLPEAN